MYNRSYNFKIFTNINTTFDTHDEKNVCDDEDASEAAAAEPHVFAR